LELIVVVVCAVGGVLGAFRLANWSGGAVGAARWPLFFAGSSSSSLLPTAGLVVRIRSEEQALLAYLGDDYRRFAAGRPVSFRVVGREAEP
jgi:protein-S-isoprenylcysteine O-methyltransferase Ste14